MAKQKETSQLPRTAAFLAPLLLVAAAAAVWFSSAATGGADTSAPMRLAALRANSAVAGDNRAVGQLADLVGSGSLGGSAGEQARAALASRERLVAFNEATERMSNALVSMADRIALASGENPAVADLAQGIAVLRVELAALRGRPAEAEATASRLVEDAVRVSALVDALTGSTSNLDVAVLEDSATAGFLAEQMLIARGAADVVRAESVSLVRTAAAARELAALAAAGGLPAASAGGVAGLLAPAMPWLPIGLIALALVLIIALLVSSSRDADLRRAAVEQSDQNERNQQAILRLLDELGSLADGDLTVEATVTEDITGAIADSINYAIEALRELVTTIDGTAAMVDSATRQTENTAVHMNRAAQKQALEIAAATESIAAIAASIEEVSGNAERSADVARHSVDVAHKGGDAVRRTIEGMNTIRETIQETSKRIKRLGESSQEIGNIVELINDIAEQTNILALNASIQASMAGEAGRGFAVVADEVQRLAERSTNATKQIEVLVRTIQADTNEAVVSMERSTTDVVGGALLAENAGAALDEIEQVSNQIASLVQNIYGSARQQSQSASDIHRRTRSLKEISGQTGKAVGATTSSIAKLAQLAGELRKSVSGFRLPESANVTRITRPVREGAAGDVSQREAG